MYERLGSRIVWVCIGGSLALGVMTSAIVAVIGARYLRLSTAKALLSLAISLAWVVPLGLARIWSTRDLIRTSLSWRGDGRRPDRAAEVWHAIVLGPHIVARRALLGIGAGLVPLAVVLPPALWDEPAWVAVPTLVGFAGSLGAAWVLLRFGTELVVRPFVEDVARHLPADFEAATSTWRLRAKALAPLPIVAAFSVLAAGAFSDSTQSGALRLTIALACALAACTIAAVIYLIVTRSVLDPLDDLLAATQRVRHGDVTVQVPVVTADDLGELASSFNEMLANLRRHEEELRASRARVVAAADAERRRAERDLHDGAQQQLVLLGLKLAAAQRLAERDSPAAAGAIRELRGDLEDAIRQLRELAHGIYPALLENEGLPGALGQAVERAAIPASLECDGAGRYPAELEAAVYFCCLEALQNAAKHAGDGARATVRVAERDGALVFEVADDGRGFVNADVSADSAGLQNMADRIGALGGSVRVESAPGEGTMVTGAIRLA
jgi:signal transduction histidine kinase